MSKKKQSTIFARILLFVCLAVFTILFSSFYAFEQIEYKEKKTSLLKRQQLITQSQAIIVAQYLQNNNEDAISLTFSGVLSNPSIVGVMIIGRNGEPLYRFGEFASSKYQLFEQETDIMNFSGQTVRTLGVLRTVATERQIVENIQQRRKFYAVVFSILFIAIVVAVYASIHFVVAIPLNKLVNAIKESRSGNPTPVGWSGNNEIGLVISEYENLQVSQARAYTQLREELRQREELNTELVMMKEAAEQASRAKSEFLATMSHELRTPLNTIIGFSEVIKNQDFGTHEATEYLEYSSDIHESGQHLLGLINDILDLAKIESGTHELNEENVDLESEIRSTMRVLAHSIQDDDLTLQQEIGLELPSIRADRRRLRQIFANLVSNAVKFTDPGGRITVKADFNEKNGFVVQVIDTGIGIAPESISKALSRFGQIDNGLDRRFEGTGLGLPIAKALVELHGGALALESQVGNGTTVILHFPPGRAIIPRPVIEAGEKTHRISTTASPAIPNPI